MHWQRPAKPGRRVHNEHPQDQVCFKNMRHLPPSAAQDVVTYGLVEHLYDETGRRGTAPAVAGSLEPRSEFRVASPARYMSFHARPRDLRLTPRVGHAPNHEVGSRDPRAI